MIILTFFIRKLKSRLDQKNILPQFNNDILSIYALIKSFFFLKNKTSKQQCLKKIDILTTQ